MLSASGNSGNGPDASNGRGGESEPGAAPGQGQGKGNGNGKTPPGQDNDKLTGRENALTRGNGLKIGLLRKFQADEQGIVGNIILILERIVNGETHVPPGDMAGLEAVVREVAAGYTVVGQECTYNELNQLASVYDPLRDETFEYAWDAAGDLVRTGTADLAWDEQGRLTRIVWADSWGVEFTYDAEGRRLTKTTFNHQDEGRQTTTFHYLAGTNQVLWEEGPDGLRLDYTYDPTGRRLTLTYRGETYWYVYNGHGDAVGLVDAAGSMVARYEYDDYGRVVHMWGADGQEVREGQGQVHYLNGDITVGTVSPEGGSSSEGTEGGGDSPNGKGEGLEKKNETGTPGDASGTGGGGAGGGSGGGLVGTDAVTGETGATSTCDSACGIVKLNPYRYAGYRYDRETELYFLKSRYYDSWSNRFVSRDRERGVLSSPLTLNRYSYALNAPPNFLDPTGTVAVLANAPRTFLEFKALDEDSRVRLYQSLLVALGFLPPSGVDGLHGPQTNHALLRFCRQNGIIEPFSEGEIGPDTYRALLKEDRQIAPLRG